MRVYGTSSTYVHLRPVNPLLFLTFRSGLISVTPIHERTHCGTFLGVIKEMIPLGLFEDMSEICPSEDEVSEENPDRELDLLVGPNQQLAKSFIRNLLNDSGWKDQFIQGKEIYAPTARQNPSLCQQTENSETTGSSGPLLTIMLTQCRHILSCCDGADMADKSTARASAKVRRTIKARALRLPFHHPSEPQP